jgi:hypothetical protein
VLCVGRLQDMGKFKNKSANRRRWKKQMKKELDLPDDFPLYVPSTPSCELTDKEKHALYTQALTVGSLPVTTVIQPFSSAFFVPDLEERKDVEYRRIRLEESCLDSEHPFCAIVTDTKSCSSCPNCFYKTSIEAAEENRDPAMLKLKACAKNWYMKLEVLKKNNCDPLSGFPSNCIPGILLFDSESNKQEENDKKSSWAVSEKKYGKHGWKVKKVITFAKPILDVQGVVQGHPKNLYKSLYLAGDLTTAGPRPKNKKLLEAWYTERKKGLSNAIRSRVLAFVK